MAAAERRPLPGPARSMDAGDERDGAAGEDGGGSPLGRAASGGGERRRRRESPRRGDGRHRLPAQAARPSRPARYRRTLLLNQSMAASGRPFASRKRAGRSAPVSSEGVRPTSSSAPSWPSAGESMTPWPEQPQARKRVSTSSANPSSGR